MLVTISDKTTRTCFLLFFFSYPDFKESVLASLKTFSNRCDAWDISDSALDSCAVHDLASNSICLCEVLKEKCGVLSMFYITRLSVGFLYTRTCANIEMEKNKTNSG